MKYLLVLFGLIATSWAVQPSTQMCQDKISTCFYEAGTIIIPISIQAYMNMVLELLVEVDCTTIAALVNLGTELSYNETTSGSVVTAVISVGVAIDIDLNLNAVAVIKLLGLIQIGAGACTITYHDLNFIINFTAVFDVGDASNCKIKQITFICTKSNCSISQSGNSSVDTIIGDFKDTICNQSFNGMQTILQNVLSECIDP